jgi:hypothetical protein
MKNISALLVISVIFLNNCIINCTEVHGKSLYPIDSSRKSDDDSTRLEFIYGRNKLFFSQAFKSLNIPYNSDIYLFCEHFYIKSGFIIWNVSKNKYRVAYYSINTKSIRLVKRIEEQKVIIKNYFRAYNNVEEIYKELLVPDVTTIPRLKIDLIRCTLSENAIYTFNRDELHHGDNSQYLQRLDSLLACKNKTLP